MTQSARPLVRAWFGIAVLSLVLAGLFSLVLVVGRMPAFSGLFTDPLFFRRGLVVHVDLALVVWFHAFLAGLIAGVPTLRAPGPVERGGPALAVFGIILMVAAAGVPDARPILANYVPVVDHPFFVAGLCLFGAGVLCTVLAPRLWRLSEESAVGALPLPPAARTALRAGGLALIVAALTFLGGALSTPDALEIDARAELIVWGGGHILQIASVCGMLAIWLTLTTAVTGEAPLSRRAAAALFALLLWPALPAPAIAGFGTWHGEAHGYFTDLMRWGIFPVVTLVLFACLRTLRAARRRGVALGQDPRVLGFAASAGLTLAGFGIGAFIHGSNTVVPGHYHASIGAVTVAFMAGLWPLGEGLGLRLPAGRLDRARRWQPLAFGVGQLVFALGFTVAGSEGALRKTYGAEQHIRSAAEWLGLTLMGLGGAVAIVAGLTFLAMAVAALLPARARLREAHPVATAPLPKSL